ncbi:MAG: MFS transporter [Candidatus Velthaea sp.]
MRSGYARLAALWFGLQCVWGAVLAITLQTRSIALMPANGIGAYAMLAAGGAAAGTLTQLAAGPFADRRLRAAGDRRPFYLAGVALALPAIAWLYLAPDYGQLVAAFLLLQIAMNVVTGPYQAIVPDYVADEHAGAAASWLGIFQPLGNAGGLIVAGFVADLRVVAFVLIAAVAGSWAVTARYVRNLPLQPAAGASALRIDRNFRTLLASRMAINFGFYTLLGFLFFFVQQSLGIDGAAIRTTTALLFLTFTLTNVAGAIAAAKPADRYDKRSVVLVANGIVAVGLMLLATATSLVPAFIAAAIAGGAWGAYFIADWALACTLLPRGAMASAMGTWNVAAAVPQILAPLITAPIVEHVNSSAPGAGPRIAVALAIVEFTAGALWLFRLPARGVAARNEPRGNAR